VNNPKFSVIIPTYNRVNQIKDAIKSVLEQTLQSFEIIVIDNCSTDNTVSLINNFKDKRIKFFSVKNKGIIAYSRNFGIKKSIGKYIAFLDSDDSWAKNKLEECIPYLENGSDLIYHNLIIKNNQKNFFPFKKKCLCRKLDKDNIYNDLISNGPAFPTSSVIVKKNIFKKIKYFNENKNLVTWEDFDAWIRLSNMTNNFYRINKNLGYLGQGANNLLNFKKRIENIFKFKFKYLKSNLELPDWCLYELSKLYFRTENYDLAIKYFTKINFKLKNIKNFFKVLIYYFLIKIKKLTKISF